MIKLKNIFKGKLTEAATASDITTLANDQLVNKIATNATKVSDAMEKAGLKTEADLEEAELVNHMYDYRGGVEYVLRDPSQAEEVSESIRQWTERKGFTIVKHKISKSGRVGYFYFRIGQDPERDAQRIQGYFSSKIEISKFRFNVREKRQRRPEPQAVAPAPQQPQI